MKKLDILYLYAEVVGYTAALLEKLATHERVSHITVVSWDIKKLTSYKLPRLPNIEHIPRSSLSSGSLVELALALHPDIVVTSGWMDSGYNTAIRNLKRLQPNCVRVCGIDNKYDKSAKVLASYMRAKLMYRDLFSYAWTAGPSQHAYATHVGFRSNQILPNLLSADTTKIPSVPGQAAKRFVYLGRLSEEKGVLNLVKAYSTLPAATQEQWPLVLIGDGPLRGAIHKLTNSNVTITGYLQDEALHNQLKLGGVCVTPSYREKWGVSIHEMAYAGYPMINSTECGANISFLIEDYNGYSYPARDPRMLASRMTQIADLPASTRQLFSQRSSSLGRKLLLEHSAHTLLSVAPGRCEA